MNRIKKKAFFMIIVLVGLTSMVHVKDANAKEGSVLFVSPHRVTIPAKGKIQILNVANKSDKTRRYNLQTINQIMTKNGSTKRADNFPYSAKRMLRFVPKRFTLKPGERQVVRVMVRRPKNLADGDYHAHLLFREVPLRSKNKKDLQDQRNNGLSFKIEAVYGVAVPIVVQHGKINSKLSIAKVALKTGARPALNFTFKREGNAEGSGMLKITYIRPGQDDVDIAPEQWVRLYHEIDTVNKDVELSLLKDIKLSGGKIHITLTDKSNRKNPVLLAETEIVIP